MRASPGRGAHFCPTGRAVQDQLDPTGPADSILFADRHATFGTKGLTTGSAAPCGQVCLGATRRATLAKIEAIRDLADTTAGHIRDKLPKIYSWELIDEIFTQPYCRIDNLVRKGIAKRQTASRYLKLLAEMGVLEERKTGREKLFVNPGLLSLLADEGEVQ